MTASLGPVPVLDITALFGPASGARDKTDRDVVRAAASCGFMVIGGLPDDIGVDMASRLQLLRIFDAPATTIDGLARNQHDPSRPLIYRGWFALAEGRVHHYEGMEIGPDIAHGQSVLDTDDPLRGPTPLPPEDALPGWRNAVRNYYLGMERTADALMRCIARGLGVPEKTFSRLFTGGMSALRLLRYPVRPPSAHATIPPEQLYVWHNGARREIISEAHVDFGFLTVLAQDETGGLQAKMSDGDWIDIPPLDRHLVVNFGKLLERWTSGRFRATEHRVLAPGKERFSLPFFYEPRVDAVTRPLPLTEARPFTPFVYGDHVWSSIPRLRRLFGERTGPVAGFHMNAMQ